MTIMINVMVMKTRIMMMTTIMINIVLMMTMPSGFPPTSRPDQLGQRSRRSWSENRNSVCTLVCITILAHSTHVIVVSSPLMYPYNKLGRRGYFSSLSLQAMPPISRRAGYQRGDKGSLWQQRPWPDGLLKVPIWFPLKTYSSNCSSSKWRMFRAGISNIFIVNTVGELLDISSGSYTSYSQQVVSSIFTLQIKF